MPPKKKIQKSDILAAATQTIRKKGTAALTVRNIAAELNCSTQPLYSEFQNLEQLRQELVVYIRDHYLRVQCSNYKEFARWFLRFAGEEPELFQFIYLRPRAPEERLLDDANCEQTVHQLARSLEMERAQAWQMHQRMQYHCYGLGVMIATGYRRMSQQEIDDELTEFYCIMLRHYKQIATDQELAYWLHRSRNLMS